MTKPTLACQVCGSGFHGRRDRRHCGALECKKELKRRYDRERYRENRDEIIDRAKAWYGENREHKREYDAAYREANREHRLALKREWSRNNPKTREQSVIASAAHRVRSIGGEVFRITERDLRRSLERFRHSCAVCEVRFSDDVGVEWDHIVSVRRGGRHSVGNIWPLCLPCNRNKNHRLLSDWLLRVRPCAAAI